MVASTIAKLCQSSHVEGHDCPLQEVGTISIVIPAERAAREPGPTAPPRCRERWVPALAALGRDDGGRGLFKFVATADLATTPMNYRHAFHAGNFADVVKHAVLVRILLHLHSKPAAFRVIDTHAGAGLYDLAGPEANRSLEWRAGIGRILTAPIGAPARALLAPYFHAVASFNAGARVTTYPGSPALARSFLRP